MLEFATRTGWAQFGILLRRATTIAKRDKTTNIARMMPAIVFSVLMGMMWLQEGGDDSGPAVQSVAGGIFFFLINQVDSSLTWFQLSCLSRQC
jgi:hypothetical protein